MFAPSQTDVRRFFCGAWRKHQSAQPLTALESLAVQWISEHPEYRDDLADEEAAVLRHYGVESGRTNPFLHLSMHVSISEQASIDQPRGVTTVLTLRAAQLGSLHEAHHEAMESLGEMLWESQRSGRPPDGERYLERLRLRAGTAGLAPPPRQP